jgi:hypothetical protein
MSLAEVQHIGNVQFNSPEGASGHLSAILTIETVLPAIGRSGSAQTRRKVQTLSGLSVSNTNRGRQLLHDLRRPPEDLP